LSKEEQVQRKATHYVIALYFINLSKQTANSPVGDRMDCNAVVILGYDRLDCSSVTINYLSTMTGVEDQDRVACLDLLITLQTLETTNDCIP